MTTSTRQWPSFAALMFLVAVVVVNTWEGLFGMLSSLLVAVPPRHIFLDFGAADGSSVDVFLGAAVVNGSSTAMDGSQRNRGVLRAAAAAAGARVLWELHVFEANPNLVNLLEQQRERLLTEKPRRVATYTLWKATAISTFDGVTEFIFDNKEEGSAGSTTNSESLSAVGTRITVNAVDIVTLFTTVLHARPEDTVIVKVDIEGGEYALLRRMVHKGLLPLIDQIAIEWHEDNGHVFAEPDVDALRTKEGQARKAIHDKYKFQRKALMWMLEEGGIEKLSTWA